MDLFMTQLQIDSSRRSPLTPRQRPPVIRTGTISANLPYDSPQPETQNNITWILIIILILLYVLFLFFVFLISKK